jgi:transcriptional regulator with XRE-family HTH domain
MDGETLKKQVGLKIKELRQKRGWSRDQVADKLEMSGNGIGHIERGEVDMSLVRLSKIAQAFNAKIKVEIDDSLSSNEKNVFNFNKAKITKTTYLNIVDITSLEINEINLKHELEKALILLQEREKEVDYLKREVTYLSEENSRLKRNIYD